MDADVRPLLQTIIERLDGLTPRLDAIDAGVAIAQTEARAAHAEAREAREETRQLGRIVTLLGQGFNNLSDTQADTLRALGTLATEVHQMNDRLGRIVERSVRSQTDEVERYASVESRISALEKQWRALSAERAR